MKEEYCPCLVHLLVHLLLAPGRPPGSARLLAVLILPHLRQAMYQAICKGGIYNNHNLGVGEGVHLLVVGLDVDVEAGSLHEAVVTIVALVRLLPRVQPLVVHPRLLGAEALVVLCSAPSVPQPVVQSRRRPLLGPSPG